MFKIVSTPKNTTIECEGTVTDMMEEYMQITKCAMLRLAGFFIENQMKGGMPRELGEIIFTVTTAEGFKRVITDVIKEYQRAGGDGDIMISAMGADVRNPKEAEEQRRAFDSLDIVKELRRKMQ